LSRKNPQISEGSLRNLRGVPSLLRRRPSD